MEKTIPALVVTILSTCYVMAQEYRWQQRVEYTMNASLDVNTNKVMGTQKLIYFNNSPDTLSKVYYHLYFNAFQPGSMMDVRSRNIGDPDPRIGERISKLNETEIGYQHVLSLLQDGKETSYKVSGTVLEVTLAKPMLPRTKTTFDMKFEAQVPVQIRRSGRNNKEGIAFTMTQWYPKLAEYDFQGWHAYQYVAREFHGVWGDFDVTLSVDPTFVIAGTGKLQNADKIGYGYEKPGAKVTRPSGNLVWHFVAKDVLDFAWAADPDYTHDKVQVPDGPELHFFYQKNDKTKDTWPKMLENGIKTFQYLNTHFGKYPFDTYSVIQGGDGGMEYPMCTMILGEGTLAGTTGTMVHEVAHSWYQMTLGSNESLHAWMDEGFADFASAETKASFMPNENPHSNNYLRYFNLVKGSTQEPASQASDHFSTNRAYTIAAYSEGAIFLNQMKYLIGDENFYKGMIRYYNTWKMRHPEPNDFVRIMEKTSGLQLHWYLRYWIGTTKKIDYNINWVTEQDGVTSISLGRIGEMPMPIDLMVTYSDGKKELFYIPMNELMGNKPVEDKTITRTDLEVWPWVNPSYSVKFQRPASVIAVEIDPSQRMADVNPANGKWTVTSK